MNSNNISDKIISDHKDAFENKLYMATQDLKLKAFAEKHIKILDCARFCPKTKENNRCCCGRNKNDHKDYPPLYKRGENEKWNPETDLVQIPTNAYGEMKLSGFRVLAGIHLKYIRACSTSTLNADLYHVMTRIWDLQKPELIISINGGAKKMIPLSNEQKSAFKRGLINVSKTASTWIITGGFNFGVSKLVGEAARDYNIASQDKAFTVLGIGAWGSVYNRKDLVLKDGHNRVTYNNADGQFTLKGQAPLDPNHDAFVLFDGGIEEVFGLEIQFRTEFEMFVSRKAKCSVVQVIVEGGKKCIVTADEALKQGIPVVVMKGSKRAADLICDVIEANEDIMNEIIENGLNSYAKEWSIATVKEMEDLTKNLKSLHDFRKNKLIHIFSMSDFTKNLDRAILEAAFSGKIDGKELTHDEKLKLAMTFNRPDVAEECILEPSASKDQRTDYGQYMKSALIKNQWRFVDLFLSRGTKVESFLSKKLLHCLYFGNEVNKHINANTSNIINFLKHKVRTKDHSQLSTIGLIVKMLTKNVIHHMYHEKKVVKCCGATDVMDQESTMEEYNRGYSSNDLTDQAGSKTEVPIDIETYVEPIIVTKKKRARNNCCVPSQYQNIQKQYIYTKHPPKNKQKQQLYTEQDLFLWALLTQRWEMAKIFWESGKDHIGSALIACVICKSLSKIANKEGEAEMMVTLQNYQEEFENLAINILTEVYWRDKPRTHLLLIRALPYWGRVTCMEVANKCNLINFLSHSACQTRLNTIWLGGMSMYTNMFWFLINLPFAFLTSKWFIFPSRNIEDFDQSTMDSSLKVNSTDSDLQDNHDNAMMSDFQIKSSTIKIDHEVPLVHKKKEYLTTFRKQQQITWKNVTFCEAVSLYYNAPITKFAMYIISYLTFLTIYSYMTLVELLPITNVTITSQRQTEYITYTYVLSFVLEELRQFAADSSYNSFSGKLIYWISSIWNIYDLCLYIFFLLAVILRHIATIDFVYARTLFSIALSMFFLRFLQFYYADRSIGPKVISVSRMIKDILFFLALYVIAIFAYGTLAQALLFNNTPLDGSLLLNIVFMPYWQSYGDLHIDYVQGQTAVKNVNPTPNAMVIVGFAIYMLFTNALLMNMLVAMFTNTFQKVEDNSNKLWAFNRYQLIEEFYFKPILPPPLNVFEIIWRTFHGIRSMVRQDVTLKKHDLVVNLCHDEDLRSSGFEQQCMETCLLDNPLLKPPSDSDQSISSVPKEDKEVTLNTATMAEKKELNEKRMFAIMETMTEIKLEMKTIASQVHKVRRHQKKERGLSRSGTMIRDPRVPRPIRIVEPVDIDDENS